MCVCVYFFGGDVLSALALCLPGLLYTYLNQVDWLNHVGPAKMSVIGGIQLDIGD